MGESSPDVSSTNSKSEQEDVPSTPLPKKKHKKCKKTIVTELDTSDEGSVIMTEK